jgi:hypothetical protein
LVRRNFYKIESSQYFSILEEQDFYISAVERSYLKYIERYSIASIYPASLRFFTSNIKYWGKYPFSSINPSIIDLYNFVFKKVIEENTPDNIKIYSQSGEEYFDDADAKREFTEIFKNMFINKVGIHYSYCLFILGRRVQSIQEIQNEVLKTTFKKLFGQNVNNITFTFEIQIKYAFSRDDFIKFYVTNTASSTNTSGREDLIHITVDMNISKYAEEIQQAKKLIQSKCVELLINLAQNTLDLYIGIDTYKSMYFHINMSSNNQIPSKLIYYYKKTSLHPQISIFRYVLSNNINKASWTFYIITER